ncbi:MAG: Na/Pi cotransporter family protein [Variovorax sp.]|nr:Na/Pi cotransporter family protein [Variovorax sp.]
MLGSLLGGLALFLFGLELLTDGFKTIAGPKLQTILGRMTANRFRGVVAGGVVTAILNSSTITTVLMVGFVSAGLMTLAQTVPMIMGANIGSTFTAQIIAFNVSALAPFMLAIGFLGRAFATRELLRQLGSVLLGFGLLFLGIQFMSDATHPLRTYQPFIDAMQNMKGPLLGIVVGAVFTAIVQSSAATLAIIIALGAQGLMPLEAGIALILGANVGTCGTALLAAIGRPPEALQVGIVHLLFNVLGVLFFVFIIPQLADFVRAISPSSPELEGAARLAAETPRQVANTHTIFSVGSTLILIWFVGPIARFARWLVPDRPRTDVGAGEPVYLDDASLAAASLGLEKVYLEVERLGGMILRTLKAGLAATIETTPQDLQTLLDEDREIDRLTSSILHYLGRLSEGEHSEDEGRKIVGLTQVTSSLDGIRDVVTSNLIVARQQRIDEAAAGLSRLRDEHTREFVQAVLNNLEQVIGMLHRTGSARAPAAAAAMTPKPEIEALAAAARRSVFDRLRLTEKADVLDFRRATDLIEAIRQIARFARRIARTVRDQGL